MSQSPDGSYPPPYGSPDPYGAASQPPAYGVQPPAYGVQPPAHGVQPPAHGVQPPAYGVQPPSQGGPPFYPPPRNGGAGKVVGIVIAVVVGLFVIAVGGLMALGLASQNPQAAGPAASESPSSGFADGQRITSVRLHPGDCVRSKAKGDVSDMDVVSCTESHDGEVIGTYKVTGSTYPGEDAIAKEAETRCAAFVPTNLETTDREDLSNYFIYPKRANWGVGDRTVECLVVADQPLTTPLSEL